MPILFFMDSYTGLTWTLCHSRASNDGSTRRNMPSRRTSFTKISSLKNMVIMIFPQDKDKKYVHQCPVSLIKRYFDLLSIINSVMENIQCSCLWLFDIAIFLYEKIQLLTLYIFLWWVKLLVLSFGILGGKND